MDSFDPSVLVAISDITDGSMSKAVDESIRDANRERFLATHDIDQKQTVLVYLVYEGDDYCRFSRVDDALAGDGIIRQPGMVNDGLFTTTTGLAMLLPVADCVAAVLYDPIHCALGLVHLGRHNLEQTAATKAVRFMQDSFASDPADVKVFLGPAASKTSYPLYAFDGRGLQDVTLEQLKAAGIDESNVTVDTRDTTTNPTLYSHSEFLKGNRELDGRQAVVAMLRP